MSDKMKAGTLTANPVLSGMVRLVLFGPFAALVVLFLWGWHTNYLDPGPHIEGRTLYDWGSQLWGKRESGEYKSATDTLSQHLDSVVPAAIAWTKTRESLPRGVFFSLTVLGQGKGFKIFGEEAHGYRGMGANILGVVALDRPDARAALERMAVDPDIYDYERDIARGHLGLLRAVDGWSSASLKRSSPQ
jgi:hypothetical protein